MIQIDENQPIEVRKRVLLDIASHDTIYMRVMSRGRIEEELGHSGHYLGDTELDVMYATNDDSDLWIEADDSTEEDDIFEDDDGREWSISESIAEMIENKVIIKNTWKEGGVFWAYVKGATGVYACVDFSYIDNNLGGIHDSFLLSFFDGTEDDVEFDLVDGVVVTPKTTVIYFSGQEVKKLREEGLFKFME